MAECSVRDGGIDRQAGSFQAIADPYIRIDPTFTVMVDGVERFGSEVYGLEFSEEIGAGIPEPATLWLLLLTLCCFGAARRAKPMSPVIDYFVRPANGR